MASPTMLSTISPETIKKAFKEIMDDEAQHVKLFPERPETGGRDAATETDLQGTRAY